MHGKAYLPMDVATESEVADTEGSTATDPLKVRNGQSSFLCVPFTTSLENRR